MLKQQREKILVATGSEYREKKALKKYLDLVHQRLNLEVLDLFFLEYVSPADDFATIQAMLEELYRWQEQGLIRYVGVTVHNRAIAMKLIEERKVELHLLVLVGVRY